MYANNENIGFYYVMHSAVHLWPSWICMRDKNNLAQLEFYYDMLLLTVRYDDVEVKILIVIFVPAW